MSKAIIPEKRSKKLTRLIDEALSKAISPEPGSPKILAEAIRCSMFPGGKRYRPLLCLGACEAVGASFMRALTTACAIEMIHAYSLVHDDLPSMDNAATRRGRPSCHAKFGQANAILVGDALLTRAFEVLALNSNKNSSEIIRMIAKASGTSGLIAGQVLDVRAASKNQSLNKSQIEDIAMKKTASLINASVIAGGRCAGASPKELKKLQGYGLRVGLAFQFMDDVHDNDGLVKLEGRERVAKKAILLIGEAKDFLKDLSGNTKLLNELADWIIRI